jgi:D-lyxose ketol-isomerase
MIINEPEIARAATTTVKKLWGTEYWLTNTPRYCLKFLKVIPGYQCSIHAHKKKGETFIGFMGTLKLMIHNGDKEIVDTIGIDPGRQYEIAPGVFHSFQAINECWVIEVSSHHDDKDVIRLQESRKLEP